MEDKILEEKQEEMSKETIERKTKNKTEKTLNKIALIIAGVVLLIVALFAIYWVILSATGQQYYITMYPDPFYPIRKFFHLE